MIKIKIIEEDIQKCRNFACKKCDTTYNRFGKKYTEREDRIFSGKLAEFVFFKLLVSRGINIEEEPLFEIWEDINKGDMGDFKTIDGKTIDIKAARKHFHTRIMVPYDQFENGKCKDIYVGVKINETITEGEVWGFCSKDELRPKRDWGEGPAYWENLKDLKDINLLLTQF